MTGAPRNSLQRIFLGWKTGKAQVPKEEQKLSLGPMKGAVARLAEPVDDKPLLIGEGTETVLSAMRATGLPGWATFGTSGLKGFNPPDDIKWIILLAENDGGPNEKALAGLVPLLRERGIRVDVAKPPSGLKDFNDLINGTSGHTPEAGLAVIRQAVEAAQTGAASATISGDEDDGVTERGFSLTETGLYRRKNKKWDWISQSFEILGLARDARDAHGQSDNWGVLVRFSDKDGAVCEVLVDITALHKDTGMALGALTRQGMDIRCTAPARRLFAEYLAGIDTRTRVTIVHRTGWFDLNGRRAFALPGKIIGDGGIERVMPARTVNGFYARRGSLNEWREGVGALAHQTQIVALLDLDRARGAAIADRRL